MKPIQHPTIEDVPSFARPTYSQSIKTDGKQVLPTFPPHIVKKSAAIRKAPLSDPVFRIGKKI